jgi:small subunit ribosomal protein S17
MTEKNMIQRLLVGEVLSDKMHKTVVVAVGRSYMHPTLKKVVKTTKKYKVHDENEQAKLGDTVEICEGRPVSKTKYMYLHKVVARRAS